MRKIVILAFAALIAAGSSSLLAQSVTSALRGPAPFSEEPAAPRMTPLRNTSEREPRNYPEQPPLIPHQIEGYQVDINGNKCLSCHSRSRTAESQAPITCQPGSGSMDRPTSSFAYAATRGSLTAATPRSPARPRRRARSGRRRAGP